jgi:hypothetical protein
MGIMMGEETDLEKKFHQDWKEKYDKELQLSKQDPTRPTPTKLNKAQRRALYYEHTKNQFIIFGNYLLVQEAVNIPGLNGILLSTPFGNTEQVIGRAREQIYLDEDGQERYKERIIYDIVDPFDRFETMSYNRQRLYKTFHYIVHRQVDEGKTRDGKKE